MGFLKSQQLLQRMQTQFQGFRLWKFAERSVEIQRLVARKPHR